MVCNNPDFEDEADDEAGVSGLNEQPKPKPQLQPSNKLAVASSVKNVGHTRLTANRT